MRLNATKGTFLNLALFNLCCMLSILHIEEGGAEDPLLVLSVRSLALGEAMTGIADDEDLIFYNPSGLVMLEDSRLTLIGLRAN